MNATQVAQQVFNVEQRVAPVVVQAVNELLKVNQNLSKDEIEMVLLQVAVDSFHLALAELLDFINAWQMQPDSENYPVKYRGLIEG